MEHESFESERIAGVLNDLFVPIKVDREERPDVDRVYMTFVQATTGSGGWPMSVWLTPDLKPFFGGTYFAPDSRYGRPGFRDVLEHLKKLWDNDRPKILKSAQDVMDLLSRASAPNRQTVSEEVLKQGFRYFQNAYDRRNGGFDGAPKFPRPSVFNFLLRFYDRFE